MAHHTQGLVHNVSSLLPAEAALHSLASCWRFSTKTSCLVITSIASALRHLFWWLQAWYQESPCAPSPTCQGLSSKVQCRAYWSKTSNRFGTSELSTGVQTEGEGNQSWHPSNLVLQLFWARIQAFDWEMHLIPPLSKQTSPRGNPGPVAFF